MKRRRLLLIALSAITVNAYAQLPEDALRMSWNKVSGTARIQAIGGAAGALGGDISSLFYNPAGLSFFKTSEIVLSPGFGFLKNTGNFRDTKAKGDMTGSFAMGTSGLVIGYPDRFNGRKSNAFSIGVNRMADFNSNVYYRGFNDLSSYSEQFLEEARNAAVDTNRIYDFPFTSGLAYYTYLIDTILDNSGNVVGFKSLAPLSTGVNQERTIETSGGITELALGVATNFSDAIYLGASLGIPIMNYQRTTRFRESDASGDPDNDFNYSEYVQDYSSKGVGVNLKLGLIFKLKPEDPLRIGLGIHTPTLYGLSERSTSYMETDTEGYPPSPGFVSVTSGELNNNQDASFRYDLVSPWKFMVSGAYIIGQTEDVKSQQGFISADLEYVTHGSSRFSSGQPETGDEEYYSAVNNITKQLYKGALNARLGGELKFNTYMVRAGFAYYGNPYNDEELKANMMNLSGGVGYRNKGIFVDLTYQHQLQKNVDFPYRLEDKPNTFATINGSGGNILLSFGFKF